MMAKKKQASEGMKLIRCFVSVGLVGCKREEIIEIEVDATEEDIEQAAREWMFDNIEWGFEEIQP